MHVTASNYSTLLRTKNILYLPTCIVIEMMATANSHAFRLQSARDLDIESQKSMLSMLERFHGDLSTTSDAYENGKVKLFMGDWKEDKGKADLIFADLLYNLRVLRARAHKSVKPGMDEMENGLGREWGRLCGILDRRCRLNYHKGSKTTVNYFHSSNPANWQRTMAMIILSIDDLLPVERTDTSLILLCYSRIRAQFVRQIEQIQMKTNIKDKFDSGRILCVSDVDVCISCPICMNYAGRFTVASPAKKALPQLDG